MTLRILYDGDPGIDDAIAIILAVKSGALEWVTTVGGNVPVDVATTNVLNLRWLLDRSTNKGKFPVGIGCSGSRPNDESFLRLVHGSDGLGNTRRMFRGSDSAHAKIPTATELISEVAGRYPGQITLVAAGPLTNIAKLIDYGIADAFKEIIIMGGAIKVHGNATPVAEFNVHTDPVAARTVLRSGLPITLVPLDVTTAMTVSTDSLEVFASSKDPLHRFIFMAIRHLIRFNKKYQNPNGCHIHDAVAVAVAIRRDLFETENHVVDVETMGKITNGMTVVDFRLSGIEPKNASISIATSVDGRQLLRFLFKTLLD